MDLDGQVSSPGESVIENTTAVVIAPLWPSQSWYSPLLWMHGNRSSSSSSSNTQSSNFTAKQTSSNNAPGILVDHLASLRQSFKADGIISEQACTLLLSSWREKTTIRAISQPGKYGEAGAVQGDGSP